MLETNLKSVNWIIPSKMNFRDILLCMKNLNSVFLTEHLSLYAENYTNLRSIVRIAKTMGMTVSIFTEKYHPIQYYKDLKADGATNFVISVETNHKNILHLEQVTDEVPVILEIHPTIYMTLLDFINSINSLRLQDIVIQSEDYTRTKCLSRLSTSTLIKYPLLDFQVKHLEKNQRLFGLRNSECKKCHVMQNNITISEMEVYPCFEYFKNRGNKIGMQFGEKTGIHIKAWFNEVNPLNNLICKTNCHCFNMNANMEIENANEIRP